MDPVASQVHAEVERLHRFFETWLTEPQAPAAGLATFEDAADADFVLIGTDGTVRDKAAVLAWLEGMQGRSAGEGFRIWIESPVIRTHDGATVVATYEEWQERAGAVRGRISTATFRRDPVAPHGLRWRQVHETWLPDAS